MEHGPEGGGRDDLADRWSCGEQERGATVGGDPRKHVAVELPSGDRSNPIVLESCPAESVGC